MKPRLTGVKMANFVLGIGSVRKRVGLMRQKRLQAKNSKLRNAKIKSGLGKLKDDIISGATQTVGGLAVTGIGGALVNRFRPRALLSQAHDLAEFKRLSKVHRRKISDALRARNNKGLSGAIDSVLRRGESASKIYRNYASATRNLRVDSVKTQKLFDVILNRANISSRTADNATKTGSRLINLIKGKPQKIVIVKQMIKKGKP